MLTRGARFQSSQGDDPSRDREGVAFADRGCSPLALARAHGRSHALDRRNPLRPGRPTPVLTRGARFQSSQGDDPSPDREEVAFADRGCSPLALARAHGRSHALDRRNPLRPGRPTPVLTRGARFQSSQGDDPSPDREGVAFADRGCSPLALARAHGRSHALDRRNPLRPGRPTPVLTRGARFQSSQGDDPSPDREEVAFADRGCSPLALARAHGRSHALDRRNPLRPGRPTPVLTRGARFQSSQGDDPSPDREGVAFADRGCSPLALARAHGRSHALDRRNPLRPGRPTPVLTRGARFQSSQGDDPSPDREEVAFADRGCSPLALARAHGRSHALDRRNPLRPRHPTPVLTRGARFQSSQGDDPSPDREEVAFADRGCSPLALARAHGRSHARDRRNPLRPGRPTPVLTRGARFQSSQGDDPSPDRDQAMSRAEW